MNIETLVSQDWWAAIRRVATGCATRGQTRDDFDRATRPLLHAAYQGYQMIEGNALSAERKAALRHLRRLARREFHAAQEARLSQEVA